MSAATISSVNVYQSVPQDAATLNTWLSKTVYGGNFAVANCAYTAKGAGSSNLTSSAAQRKALLAVKLNTAAAQLDMQQHVLAMYVTQ
eukprot:9236-Heterococcus_DN1.PRE.1